MQIPILKRLICPQCGSKEIKKTKLEFFKWKCEKCNLVFPDEKEVEKVKKSDEKNNGKSRKI
ncbi:MAG: hypothetical protein KKB88_00410 [Nanoarchaeota archaeon]|nr:hypothetical protein [Nanoarchaeota archaeon]